MRAKTRRVSAGRLAAVVPVLLAAAVAVTGCGQTQLGAAALYGGQRVSSTTLAAEVANLNTGYQAYKSKAQISYKPAQMPREVLTWILRFATTNEVAGREGITITREMAQQQLTAEQRQAAQSGYSLREVAVLSGLPPDMLSKVGRWLAIEGQLQDMLDHGVAPTTSAGQSALGLKINHLQCLAAKRLNIKVNPQYGAFDYGSLAVVPAVTTLSALPAVSTSSRQPATKC